MSDYRLADFKEIVQQAVKFIERYNSQKGLDVKSVLDIYVVYEHPTDYPDKFVLRKWAITPNEIHPEKTVIVEDTLEALHKHVPHNMARIERNILDEPQIIEIWL